MPVDSTIHFVEAGIDSGPIILQRRLPVYRGETYEQIARRVLTLSGELMAETLALLEAGEAPGTPQDATVGGALRVIPPDLLEEAEARLADGRYSYCEDSAPGGDV